jgi:uncharacterized protein
MIELTTRERLLLLAREALEAGVRADRAPEIPRDLAVEAFGVFVTLYLRGALRGCLGALDCRDQIVPSIVRLSAAVARDDPRFAPLGSHELPGTALDLSLLSRPESVRDHERIEIGRHGLIVVQGNRRGLLLPQVPSEHGWDRLRFLAHTCLKAGLPADAWQNGASVFRFEAEVFGERVRQVR